MEPAPVDLDPKQLFEPHVAEPDLWPEVTHQRELARFAGCLERDDAQAEGIGEAVGEAGVELPARSEEADLVRALPRLHDELARSRFEPPLPLLDQPTDDL